jgi:hypothetical protein
MIDFLWIIPNLNENINVIRLNLLKYCDYIKRKRYRSKIIVSDGGSNIKLLIVLKRLINSIKSTKNDIEIDLCLPIMRPNKNLGILNIIQKYTSKYVLIIDADWVNINEECLRELTSPLSTGEFKVVLPNLIEKQSGRVNQLIVKPLLRLLFSEILKKTSLPLNGMLGINYRYLKQIVTAPDYFWDWGGDIQIVIRGFYLSNGLVKTFNYPKIESKKRKLLDKMKDARQIIRTMLYEGFIENRLNIDRIRENLYLSWSSNPNLTDRFLKWQKFNKIKIAEDKKELKVSFNNFLSKSREDLVWFSNYLDVLYRQTKIYEILVLKNMVVDSILKVLFGIYLQHQVEETASHQVEKLQLIDLSIFAEIIFAVYITLWLERTNTQNKNFNFFLNLLSYKDTDFINSKKLQNFRKKGLTSIDINGLSDNDLQRFIEIYNNKKMSVIRKNDKLLKII